MLFCTPALQPDYVQQLLWFAPLFASAQTRAFSYLLPLYPFAALAASIGLLGLHRLFSAAVQK